MKRSNLRPTSLGAVALTLATASSAIAASVVPPSPAKRLIPPITLAAPAAQPKLVAQPNLVIVKPAYNSCPLPNPEPSPLLGAIGRLETEVMTLVGLPQPGCNDPD